MVNHIELKKTPVEPTLPIIELVPAVVSFAISALVCFVFFVISGSFPFYFLLFPITMFIMPLVTNWRAKGDAKKSHAKAMLQYEGYLQKTDEQWKKQNKAIADYYLENYPSPSTIPESIANSIAETGERLWCILPEHSEFMTFRAGVYERKSPIALQNTDAFFEEVPLSLQEKIDAISSKNCIIHQSPFVVDLKKNPFIAVRAASTQKGIHHLNAFLLSLFTTHAYDDVRLAVLCKESSGRTMDWMRWFPHIWDEQGIFRYFCADDSNKTDILDRLESVVRVRSERSGQATCYPEYVLVIEDITAFFSHSVSRYFPSTETQFGIRIIFVLSEQETVPSICSLIIDTNRNTLMENRLKNELPITCDDIDSKTAENIARVLSNVEIVNGERSSKLPEIVTFFDLLSNDALRQATVKTIWEKNLAHIKGIGLSVPIGVKADGTRIFVDLKDGADGAHAIIAGMTGSGKTELLQTMILSLCVNYSPEQVSFAFVDFKEGGMATQFRGIPHESGILTNQGNKVAYLANRSITMLKQEKKYRGDLLSDFGLDIDRYHKKYNSASRGKMKPLPHLFVIIDESAEVVDQFREFMSEMVSLARVGRSMGIHLILSTQNPSRTVDSQIFDNANLKICLSVLSEEESKAILKTKDAAYIVNRGRAILITGNGKRCEEFQSAYTGATVTSSSENLGTEPIAIFPNGNIAQLSKVETADSSNTQLTETLAVLRSLSSTGIDHEVFSDTLTSNLYLYDIDDITLNTMGIAGLKAVVGKADVLERQSISDVVVDFDDCRNLIIYGSSRSGKTTLSEAILFDIVQRYTQNKVQCLVVATGASAMSRFANCSFVSEVLTEGESEKLYRLPRFLTNETKRRLELIQRAGATSIVDYAPISTSDKLPRIIVFFDILQHYQYATQLADVFAAGSAQAGIHVVATYQDSALPRSLASYFGGQIALQIHDDLIFKYNISYSGIVENDVGRGIYGVQTTDYLEIQAFQPSLTVANARKAGNISNDIIKQPYNINNGSIEYLNQSITPFEASKKLTVRTVGDLLNSLNETSSELPIGVFYETLEPFSISTKTKACLFSILGDKQTRDDLRLFLEDKLRKIGNVLYYGDTKPVPDETSVRSAFETASSGNKHLFVLVSYENQDFNTAGSDNHTALVNLLETTYRGKASLIVVTSARLAKSYAPLNEYCTNANCIVAIGGKHDAHVRFADVSTRILDIPVGEAYVSTSSTRFERMVIKMYT